MGFRIKEVIRRDRWDKSSEIGWRGVVKAEAISGNGSVGKVLESSLDGSEGWIPL